MSEGRQFIVETLDATGAVVGRVGVSGFRVVASRVTGTTAGAAVSIVTNGGNGQTGTVGQPVSVPPSVMVVDNKGLGVAGSTVTWLSGGGSGGTSTGNTSTTNAQGIATVGSWTMGNVTGSGSSYSLLAYSGNLQNSPIGFVVTSIASGSPFSLAISGGTSQTTTPGGILASRCSVLVTDQFANILSNATLTLSSTDAAGAFAPSSTITTNTSGVASFLYTNGTAASIQSVYANLLGSSSTVSVTFASTITSGPANNIDIVSGDGQTALSGATLALPIVVSVDDGFGNPVGSGTTLQYVIVLGSGNISRATQTPTASAGSFTWKVGATAGQNAVEISLANVSNSTITVFASGTNPTADTLQYLSGGTQTGTVATAATILEVATLGSGSSASGQLVTWAITSSNQTGSLSTDRTVSSTSGIARCVFTYGQTVGAYQVQASAGTLSGSPIVFNLTATAGSATSVALATQPLVNTQAGVAWSQQPVAITTDVYGNLVSTNTRIRAVLVSGSGTLDSAVSTFAIASGATASFSGLSYGNATGAYQTAYGSNSLASVTANAQNNAPPFASQLGFSVQPSAVVQGNSFSPTVVVAIQDSTGVTVTTATNSVTVGISSGGSISGTTSRNAVSGLASFAGLSAATNCATGSYTLAATSNGLTGATSSSFAVTASAGTSASFPNEPGWPLMAEHTGSTAPTATDSAMDVAGKWRYLNGGGFISTTDATFGTTAPISSTSVQRYQYPTTQTIGSGSINVGVWDNSGTGTANSTVSHLYWGVWFNAWGSGGTDFEMRPQVIKPFGYHAVGGATSGARNQLYFEFGSNAPVNSIVTTLTLAMKQQGPTPQSRSIGGTTTINAGSWYLYEVIMTLNSAADVADGIAEVWITPAGGTSTRVTRQTNVVYMTTGNTTKFNLWKLNNIYGGSNGTTPKTRTDYVLFDHWRMTGY